MIQLKKILDHNIKFSGYIFSDGGRILDSKGKDINSHILTNNEMSVLFALSNSAGAGLMLATDKGYVLANKNKTNAENLELFNNLSFSKTIDSNIDEYKTYSAHIILDTSSKVADTIISIANQNGFSAYKSTSYCIDISPSNTNKASGVDYFKSIKNFKNLIAFGDGVNDLQIFKKSNIGVAMGNSHSTLKNLDSVAILTEDIENNDIEIALNVLIDTHKQLRPQDF